MKKKIILLFLFVLATFSGWAQNSLVFTPTVPLTTAQAGTTVTVNYKYTAAANAYIYCEIRRTTSTGAWQQTIVGANLNPAVAGTNITGSFNLLIPASTTTSANLAVPTNQYRIVMEMKTSQTGTYLTGAFPNTNINITAASTLPAISQLSSDGTNTITSACENSAISILGNNFTGATAVTVGGTPLASFAVVSNTRIDGILPSGSHTGPVVVTTPSGSGSSTGNLTVGVNGVTTNTTTITSFETYTWPHNGQTYTTSGIKTGNTTNCITELLDLTITQGSIVPAVSFTSIPLSTQVGSSLVVNYKYSNQTPGGKVAISISKNGGAEAFTYISSVGYQELTPTIQGTDVTGTFSVLIPANTIPTASLTGNENYRIKIELLDASNAFLAGNYDTINYNFTPAPIVPAVSFTSIPTSTEVGTNLVVNYKYSAPTAGGKVAISVSKNGGAFAYTFISSVAYAQLTPIAAGTDVTGSFSVLIPLNTVPTASLTGNDNYRIKIELFNSSNTWIAGNYDTINYNFTAAPVAVPAVSFTSLPTSTQVGTDLVVNYKYTSLAAGGKVAVSVTKNGGEFAYTFINSVAYSELTPTIQGTDVTGTFTLPIPALTIPTANLTGNDNYRIKIELFDASNTYLAGNYDNINYNFTPAPIVPAVSFTSVPSSTQVGTDLVVNYKYSAPDAGGKVAVSVSKNGGAFAYTYISAVAYSELTPTVSGTDITGTFTLAIPVETIPTASLTGNENYRIKIELRDAANGFLAGNYDNINYNFTAANNNYYVDADGDGYGAGTVVSLQSATAPLGYSVNDDDCDDTNATINPNATEVFDTIDNDCDGSVDEGAMLSSSLTFCKGATVASTRGTTDLQLYTSSSLTALALSGTTALSSKVYYATLNGSVRTAVTITVNPLPSTPASMTTTDAVLCKHIGSTNAVTYSVPAVVGIEEYSWSLPAGVTATSAIDTNTITVNFENASSSIAVGGIGTISARAISGQGCSSAPRSLVLTSKLPTAPTAIVMTSTDSTPHFNAVTTPAVAGVSPAVISTVGLNFLTKITKVGPYMGTSTEFTLTAPVAATAASYAWTLPGGVNPIGSVTGNVITVNFADVEPGIGLLPIVVKSVGGCGQSAARTLSLSRALPTAPTALIITDDAISSTIALTKVSAYTGKTTPLTLRATPARVQGATATSYAWILPAGVNIVSPIATATTVYQLVNTGTLEVPVMTSTAFAAWSTGSTSTITVNFADVASGTLSFPLTVFAVNGTGNSKARTRTVTAAAPTSPAITAVGGTTFNNCNSKTYSVVQTLGTSYAWTVPAGATSVLTGNTIVVNYSDVEALVGATAQVTCTASNGTGTSAPKLLNVKRVVCPVRLSNPSANAFSVKAYPNPSSSEFTIETSAKGAMSVKVYDMQGRLVEKANSDKVGSKLAKGVYNVIVNQGANTKSVRVIKK